MLVRDPECQQISDRGVITDQRTGLDFNQGPKQVEDVSCQISRHHLRRRLQLSRENELSFLEIERNNQFYELTLHNRSTEERSASEMLPMGLEVALRTDTCPARRCPAMPVPLRESCIKKQLVWMLDWRQLHFVNFK